MTALYLVNELSPGIAIPGSRALPTLQSWAPKQTLLSYSDFATSQAQALRQQYIFLTPETTSFAIPEQAAALPAVWQPVYSTDPASAALALDYLASAQASQLAIQSPLGTASMDPFTSLADLFFAPAGNPALQSTGAGQKDTTGGILPYYALLNGVNGPLAPAVVPESLNNLATGLSTAMFQRDRSQQPSPTISLADLDSSPMAAVAPMPVAEKPEEKPIKPLAVKIKVKRVSAKKSPGSPMKVSAVESSTPKPKKVSAAPKKAPKKASVKAEKVETEQKPPGSSEHDDDEKPRSPGQTRYKRHKCKTCAAKFFTSGVSLYLCCFSC